MSRYAENTSVSKDRSISEIERTLERYGADQFLYGWEAERAVISFRMMGRQVRFLMPLPDKDAEEFTITPGRRTRRSKEAALKQWEQATRQRWRALSLVIKAKMEAVESGITTFEEEFLAHILLPGGQSVGQWISPHVNMAYETGKVPKLLKDFND